MRRIVTTPKFERRLSVFLNQHGDLEKTVRETMVAIASSIKSQKLRVHKLKGSLKGCISARISYEYRIVFISKKDSVCFIDIGTHDEVY